MATSHPAVGRNGFIELLHHLRFWSIEIIYNTKKCFATIVTKIQNKIRQLNGICKQKLEFFLKIFFILFQLVCYREFTLDKSCISKECLLFSFGSSTKFNLSINMSPQFPFNVFFLSTNLNLPFSTNNFNEILNSLVNKKF